MSSDSTHAAAPFGHEKADIILRSSDNVNFRVFKLFLSLASPFFETLFDIPQPTQTSKDQEIKDGLAVIPVTEDSKTLDALLRFCYPCTLTDEPRLEALQDALDVFNTAKKYSLVAVEKKALQVIASPNVLEAEPLRSFAIAHHGRLRDETLLAAKYTLTQPLIPASFPEIGLISANDLLSLLTYHQRCGEAIYGLRLDLSWVTSHYGSAASCDWLRGCIYTPIRGIHRGTARIDAEISDCRCVVASISRYTLFNFRPLKWWEDFMEETFTGLRDKPCKATVQACVKKTVEAMKEKGCRGCSPKVTEGMRDLLILFEKKIEETVSQIELTLDF